jgi:hypothetical protein
VLLIDSLDEAETASARTKVAKLLGDLRDHPHLPRQVRILATTRPDPRVLDYFRALPRESRLDLIDDAPAEADDIALYAWERLAGLDGARRTVLAQKVAMASRGIFLYARLVLEALRAHPPVPAGPFRPFHQSFAAFLLDDEHNTDRHIDAPEMYSRIADYYWENYHTDWSRCDDYGLTYLPTHMSEGGQRPTCVALLRTFEWLYAKISRVDIRHVVSDFSLLSEKDAAPWKSFISERAHILARGDQRWPAERIFLQLATEHAEDSPVTSGAERWLQRGKCDRFWLRRADRPAATAANPCSKVF